MSPGSGWAGSRSITRPNRGHHRTPGGRTWLSWWGLLVQSTTPVQPSTPMLSCAGFLHVRLVLTSEGGYPTVYTGHGKMSRQSHDVLHGYGELTKTRQA